MRTVRFLSRGILCVLGLSLWLARLVLLPAFGQGVFTVEIGQSPPPPVTLVSHGDEWRYHKGTNAPVAGWQTVSDAVLGASWPSGRGGFGYAPNQTEVSQVQTLLPDMSTRYSMVYIRRTFELATAPDPASRLLLTMDWDDGFIAWLDGVYLTNALVGTAPNEPPLGSLATTRHESSRGDNLPQPAVTYDLGLVGARLSAGFHVLALIGLNDDINSSDLVLLADLQVAPAGSGPVVDGFFRLVQSSPIAVTGTNTLVGARGVVVNGVNASFVPGGVTWSKSQDLLPGMNRLFFASTDQDGNILASVNKDVVYEAASVSVGGTLGGNTTWNAGAGIVRLTSDLVVPAGVTLSINPGVVVLLPPATSLKAQGGVIDVAGTVENPVFFLPANGSNTWGQLSASGVGSSLTLRHAEVVAGQVMALSSAVVTVEDSALREFQATSRLFMAATNAQQVTIRRSHIARYDQIRFNSSPVLIEDCLIERIGADGTDFSNQAGITIRRTTYRFGSGTGTDAIGNGNNPDMLVEGCLIHGFPDKGVSIADFSHGTVVRNCLFYGNSIGVAAHSSSNCLFYQNTFANSTTGLSVFQDAPGQAATTGHAFATNNIAWGNTTNVHLAAPATLEMVYSDVGGLSWPGPGNISADPLFANPASGDFRLGPGSLARGSGLGGVDMGVIFPVGGIPSSPLNLAAHAAGTNQIHVWWEEDADNEAGFEIERSAGGAWALLGTVGPNETSFTDPSAVLGQFYLYRVRAVNGSGPSRYSNLAGAIRQMPITMVGGTLGSDTLWSADLGVIQVMSTVVVPNGVTLTVLAGSQVRVTNNASIRATAGGTIEILGTADRKVSLSSLNPPAIWSELSANGAEASLTVRHLDMSGGQVSIFNGAAGLVEDSFIHDYRRPGGDILTSPLMVCQGAQPVTIRRCYFREYYETLFRSGVFTIEDCLFENISGDGLDFDGAQPGTVLRRCTFRHGNAGNIDAIDVGNNGAIVSDRVVIEDCLMYDFPFDKGVSIGEEASGIVVRNCWIHHTARGVQVKDVSTATVHDCTITDVEYGLHCFEKIAGTGGGRLTNAYNNILWANSSPIFLPTPDITTNFIINVSYSDTGGTNWPGPGNINANPLFVNPLQGDYRLGPGSPCLGTGRDDDDMGAQFPVGAPMAPSHPKIQSVTHAGNQAVLLFWADSERSYSVERADQPEGGAWTKIADVAAVPPVSRQITITDNLAGAQHRFYRLVSPQQP